MKHTRPDTTLSSYSYTDQPSQLIFSYRHFLTLISLFPSFYFQTNIHSLHNVIYSQSFIFKAIQPITITIYSLSLTTPQPK